MQRRAATLAAAALCAMMLLVAFSGVSAVETYDEFESQLASEVPDLLETSADSFQTLSQMGVDQTPEHTFSLLEAHAQAHAEQHAEDETEAEDEQEVDEHDAAEHEESESDEPALLEESAETAPWHRGSKNQPVARTDKEIECLDGDCTRAIGVRKAAVGTHPNANTKPPPTKLDIALGAVKEEIMVRAKELHLEKNWSSKVASLIDEYQQKLQKVTGNIVKLRAQVKALLRKKKQIQNVQVQNKLRYKLQLAQADLNRLQKQMEHVASKENEFSDTERQLKSTMNALKNSLLKLRGQEPQKLAAEGIELP